MIDSPVVCVVDDELKVDLSNDNGLSDSSALADCFGCAESWNEGTQSWSDDDLLFVGIGRLAVFVIPGILMLLDTASWWGLNVNGRTAVDVTADCVFFFSALIKFSSVLLASPNDLVSPPDLFIAVSASSMLFFFRSIPKNAAPNSNPC